MPVSISKWTDSLARADFRWTVVGTLRNLSALALFSSPMLLAVTQYPPFAQASWLAAVFWGGLSLGMGGALVNKGARWIQERGRTRVDRDHLNMVNAGLRAVRQIIFEKGSLDPRGIEQHLLKVLSEQVLKFCPAPSAAVHASLFIKEGNSLVMRGFSAFREDRVPGAKIPVFGGEGAGRACRERKQIFYGDILREVPGCPQFSAKSYRCLLCIPILGNETECLGVVTVDSTVPDHFTPHLRDLVLQVTPFVELIHMIEYSEGFSRITQEAR